MSVSSWPNTAKTALRTLLGGFAMLCRSADWSPRLYQHLLASVRVRWHVLPLERPPVTMSENGTHTQSYSTFAGSHGTRITTSRCRKLPWLRSPCIREKCRHGMPRKDLQCRKK